MTINWDVLIAAIAAIETGDIPHAPRGDGGRAVGPLQIHQCVVDDVNRIAKVNLTLEDMELKEYYDFACRVWLGHFAEKLGPDVTPEELARMWNGGPWGNKKPATADYGQRVSAMYYDLINDHADERIASTE